MERTESSLSSTAVDGAEGEMYVKRTSWFAIFTEDADNCCYHELCIYFFDRFAYY